MVSIRRFSAAVVCEGKPLEEYDVTQDAKSAVRCFIASEAGKNFSLEFKNDSEYDAAFCIFVDGVSVEKAIIDAGQEGVLIGTFVSHTQRALFSFSAVSLTDDKNAQSPDGQLVQQAIGSIDVRIFRVENTRVDSSASDDNDGAYQEKKSQLTNKPVHESTKKGGYHQIVLGDLIKAKRIRPIILNLIDPEDEPYATLTHIYRPKNILRAQGIVPLSPCPKVSKANQPAQSTSQSQSTNRSTDTAKPPRNQGKETFQKSASSSTVPETYAKPRIHESADRNTGDSDEDSDSETELRMLKDTLAALQKRIGKMEKRRKARKAKLIATRLPE